MKNLAVAQLIGGSDHEGYLFGGIVGRVRHGLHKLNGPRRRQVVRLGAALFALLTLRTT